jgi:hypothetical protein
MPEAKKARAVGFNHVAIEVGDIEEALAFYVACSTSSFAARARHRPSSIWATSSLRSRRAVLSPPTTAAILDLWSMTRRPSAKRWPTLASNRCRVRFSTSSIHGATASRT